MSIVWCTEEFGYLDAPVNIGIINKKGTSGILVDTGIDNTTINKLMKQIKINIKEVLLTHHHADHIGGVRKLINLGITEIFAPDNELPFIHQTIIEPYTIFGGYPPKKLKNKYLMAKSNPGVKPISERKNTNGSMIYTSGHTMDHISYKFDTVIYSGDAAFSQETIDKYTLLFAINPLQAVKSAESLLELNYEILIPCHGSVCYSKKDGNQILRDTKNHFEEISNRILEIISSKKRYSTLGEIVASELRLDKIVKKRGISQYFLYQHTINGYISNLLDNNKIEFDVSSGISYVVAI